MLAGTQDMGPRQFIPGFLPFLTSLHVAVYLQSLFLFHLDYGKHMQKVGGGCALPFSIVEVHKDFLGFLKKEVLLIQNFTHCVQDPA